MQGDPKVIELLNEQLTAELTAINQYFLHAKMQQNWGYHALADYTRSESIDEMRHAERLTDRLLFLEGLPNYQRIGSLRIGQTVPEQFQADLAIEHEAVARLRPGSTMCRATGDITTALLLEAILADEEGHIDYLETQLELLTTLGEQHYLAQQLGSPPGGLIVSTRQERMSSDAGSLPTPLPGRPPTGRLLGVTVYEHHSTLVVQSPSGSVRHIDVAAVPDVARARRHVAGLWRVLHVHIDPGGSRPCQVRAATRLPVNRTVPLPVALALARVGVPGSVRIPG